MGMYDIIDGITVYCPKCGEIITNEFQTKDFAPEDRSLKTYKVGDKLPTNREYEEDIEIHSICGNCQLFTTVNVGVIYDILTNELI